MSERKGRILLCATGGFESYALPGFILALLRHCAEDVQVVLSRPAAALTSRQAVEVASRHAVFVEMDDRDEGVYVPHIELSRNADLVLVYPATVNVLAKVAHGITDELIPALIIASEKPVIFVPFTNEVMWNRPAVQRNIRTLVEDGYEVLPNCGRVEVATREGLESEYAPFPLPTLLLRIAAAIR